MMRTVLIGTYTKKEAHVDGKADGLFSARFDTETGDLSLAGSAESVNPSYLVPSPEGGSVYVANEMFDDLCSPHATLSAFRIDSDLQFEKINEVPSQGVASCYVTTDRNSRTLYGVNYKTGSVVVCPIRDDGGLGEAAQVIQHEGSGPHEDQDGPHAHSIYLDSEEAYAVVPDKGADQVCVYSVKADGRLTRGSCLGLPPGSGPRHFAFHPHGPWGYMINEISSTITSCIWRDGNLVPFETVSTLPDGWEEWNKTADIHITPDGRFLYGSNRGHDTIAAYHVDSMTGALVPIGWFDCGIFPRGFAIDPEGRWLLCAGQNSDDIIVYEIGDDGTLDRVSGTDVPTPVCIKFVS